MSFPSSSATPHLSFKYITTTTPSEHINVSTKKKQTFTIPTHLLSCYTYTQIIDQQCKHTMKLPSIFKSKETRHPWQKWPSCKHPRTLSFRAGEEIVKTVNSVYFDPVEGVETPESWFATSLETTSFSTKSEELDGETLEIVVRGVRSDRLFFEPGGDTSSILGEAKPGGFPFTESVVLAMESEDPYVDFRRSMEEMVESHGLKDWESLEELLCCYLKVNGKKNHGYVVDAFLDLLVGIAAASCSDSTSFSSVVSSISSSSPMNSFQKRDDIDEEEEMVMS